MKKNKKVPRFYLSFKIRAKNKYKKPAKITGFLFLQILANKWLTFKVQNVDLTGFKATICIVIGIISYIGDKHEK